MNPWCSLYKKKGNLTNDIRPRSDMARLSITYPDGNLDLRYSGEHSGVDFMFECLTG